MGGKDLINLDVGSLSDPYLKIRFIDVDGKNKYEKKNRYIKDNLNPKFNFKDIISTVNLANDDILRIEVWDKDTITRDDSMGHVQWTISSLAKKDVEGWHKLLPLGKKSKDKDLGQLRVIIGMQQQPVQSQIQPQFRGKSLVVDVIEGKDLINLDIGSLSDPY